MGCDVTFCNDGIGRRNAVGAHPWVRPRCVAMVAMRPIAAHPNAAHGLHCGRTRRCAPTPWPCIDPVCEVYVTPIADRQGRPFIKHNNFFINSGA
jgi:hypothetical protein